MKVLHALCFAAAITSSNSAFACSYAVREHPLLASHTLASTGAGVTSVKFAISEALLPARFAKTQHVFARTWLGVRGQRLDVRTGAVSSKNFEVVGKIDVACFYPDDSYEVLPDGRLVVWISGKLEGSNPERLILPTAATDTESAGSVWRKVNWSDDENASSAPLPTHPQPGMIQP